VSYAISLLYPRANNLTVQHLARQRATVARAVSVCGKNGAKLRCGVTIFRFQNPVFMGLAEVGFMGVR
jgi:hypothetical protein